MSCNDDIHDGFVDSGEIYCPFCDKKLQDYLIKNEPCCDFPDIINDNGRLVCLKCAVVKGYKTTSEYIDFYEKRHKLKRKSVYQRKYYLNNVMFDICVKHNIEISLHQKNKIDRVFVKIGKILPQVNGVRKRMISVNFILRNVLRMMGLPFDKIPITKSKRTLESYEAYWTKRLSLIGDRIKRVINK